LLDQIGLEPDRIQMFNMSAAMAPEFVATAQKITEQIMELGPSPLHLRKKKKD
jgi:F420-non-reducing hydrogenase iron-sulfur subunit